MLQFTWEFVGEVPNGKGKVVNGKGKKKKSKEGREELHQENGNEEGEETERSPGTAFFSGRHSKSPASERLSLQNLKWES